MQINVNTDTNGLASKLNQFKNDFPQFVKKGLIDSTVLLQTLSLRKLSEQIYQKPEAKVLRRSRSRKTKRVRSVQLWKRTSDLYRAEAAGADYSQVSSNYRTILDNNTPYAWDRHQTKYPAKTKMRSLTGRGKKATYTDIPRIDRTAHWREDAWKEGMPQMRDSFRNALAVIRRS